MGGEEPWLKYHQLRRDVGYYCSRNNIDNVTAAWLTWMKRFNAAGMNDLSQDFINHVTVSSCRRTQLYVIERDVRTALHAVSLFVCPKLIPCQDKMFMDHWVFTTGFPGDGRFLGTNFHISGFRPTSRYISEMIKHIVITEESSFSVLWHCWFGHMTRKTVSEMTYDVSSGTLNSTTLYTITEDLTKNDIADDLEWPSKVTSGMYYKRFHCLQFKK